MSKINNADIRLLFSFLAPEKILLHPDVLAQYAKNTLGIQKNITAILLADTTEEITKIVLTAQRHTLSIYPISTGHNWGYGCSAPVKEDCIILDLHRMNKILDFHEDLGLVTVQPGVTQGQLYDYLKKRNLNFMVPLTGAGPNCSLVGNSLERGYGIIPSADHFLAMVAMEAILPNGDRYRSSHDELSPDKIRGIHKWGIGPYADGLFFQGNFGIVTQITMALPKRPECIQLFRFAVKRDKSLEEIIGLTHELLVELGTNISAINFSSRERIKAMQARYDFNTQEVKPRYLANKINHFYDNDWFCLGGIYGVKKIVSAVRQHIKTKLKNKNVSGLLFLSEKKINFIKTASHYIPFIRRSAPIKNIIHTFDSLYHMLQGTPTEATLPVAYTESGSFPADKKNFNPQRDGCGIIWFVPLIPMMAEKVRLFVNIVRETCHRYGIIPVLTITTISPSCFNSAIPLLFDVNSETSRENAHACYQELFKRCKDHGFLPYRLGIHAMEHYFEADTSHLRFIKKLKKAIDPNNIIAPGRYCP